MAWNTNPKAAALKYPRRNKFRSGDESPKEEKTYGREVFTTILVALQSFPDAKLAVARALRKLSGMEDEEDLKYDRTG